MGNQHTPEELANLLDELLSANNGDSVSANADTSNPLLNTARRLTAAPDKVLSPEALDRIEAQMMKAIPQQSPRSLRISPRYSLVAAAAVFIILILIGLMLFNRSTENRIAGLSTSTATLVATDTATTAHQEPTFTATAIFTEVMPAVSSTSESAPDITSTPTVATDMTDTEVPVISTSTANPATDLPMTSTSSPEPEVASTITPSVTIQATEIPATVTVTPIPSSTPYPAVIIEGPITEIRDNSLFIYDIEVVLKVDDPLLKVLRIDDFIRVEGEILEVGNKLSIRASKLEFENPDSTSDEIATSPDGSEVWRDPGNCDNPPPPWAPAKGWRKRCEQSGSTDSNEDTGGGNGNNGHGNGNGNAGGNGNGKGNKD
ncbi:MAG TPA: hypothetical protein VHL11_25600 [Phototrophicaceae bacterium]|nr:hypothetical protein [Phototrophicaceae bacterium]